MKFQSRSRFATFAVAALLPFAASAATNTATSSSYVVIHKAEIAAPPAAVYAALGQPDKWWSPSHTYSGSAANLKLEMRAGGCFCESWDGGSVEHGRVILALRNQMLRLEASLGPLQEKAVTAILTFELSAGESGKTRVQATYRVRAPEAGLNNTSDMVDKVIGEQLARLASHVGKN